ncbi:MAG: hypothetical protein AB7S41_08140 [Parvibaculaceae bacterium]
MYSDRPPIAPLMAERPSFGFRADPSFGLLHVLGRVEQAVEQETKALKERRAADLGQFAERKSHGLLELTRAMRGVDAKALSVEIVERVRKLKVKLETNRMALEMYLRATQEIAGLMASTIREAESDGTYGYGVGPRGQGAGGW